MFKIFLIFGIFAHISGNEYTDVANRKWSILQRFDNDYLEEVTNFDKCEMVKSLFEQDFDRMFHGIESSDHDIINHADIINDIIYFLAKGLNFHQNIQVIIDIYVKHLAMWAMLTFKVCSLLKFNENNEKTDMVDDCDALALYMGSFYLINFERVNFQLKLVREEFEGSSDDVDTDESDVTKFTANDISEKLRYIHAVSNEIYFFFEPLQFSNYGPSIPNTHYFFKVSNKLNTEHMDIFHLEETEEPVSTFRGDSYETIWLRLLNIYGPELMDVENYFSSLLGENRWITDVTQLIPPKSEIELIWHEAKTFLQYLRNPKKEENQRNKGGKILMQIEKIKEIHRGKLSYIEIHNLLLHKAKEGVSDFKITLDYQALYGMKVKLEQILSPIFPDK